jgi:hypothetical protein
MFFKKLQKDLSKFFRKNKMDCPYWYDKPNFGCLLSDKKSCEGLPCDIASEFEKYHKEDNKDD